MKEKNKIIYMDDSIVMILIESKAHGNHFPIVDRDMYDKIKHFRWCIYNNGTAITRIGSKRIQMHRYLFPKYKTIDHKNGNKIDNRKENIRECTFTENTQNRRMHRGTKSGYKGVYSYAPDKWFSHIMAFGVKHYLGTFKNKKDAAIAYNEAALKYHGKFARLNII